jgi:hypothetical protein
LRVSSYPAVILHGKKLGIVQANHEFAEEQLEIAKEMMIDGIIKTSQDDVGFPFCLNTLDVAICSSWTRPSNESTVTSVDGMMPVFMTMNQVLRAGFRTENGTSLIRLTLLILGLIASAFVTSVNGRDVIAPLIVDIIPVMNRTKGNDSDDFRKENGDVSINTAWQLIMPRISYLLTHYNKIIIEGADVLMGFMRCIQLEKHIIMTLEDEDISRLDPEYNKVRTAIGDDYYFKAFLVTHSRTGRTVALYHCAHIGSHIGGVSPNTLFIAFRYIDTLH